MKIVGHLTPKVIKAFNLDYKPGEDITLSAQRKKHMEKHRQEFSDFDAIYERIPEIIAHPDYIGRHPDGQSLEYIKRIDGNVLVAVTLCDKPVSYTHLDVYKRQVYKCALRKII